MDAMLLNQVTTANRPERTCANRHCITDARYLAHHVIGNIFRQVGPAFDISDRPGNAHEKHGGRTQRSRVTAAYGENEKDDEPCPHLDREPASPNKAQHEFGTEGAYRSAYP